MLEKSFIKLYDQFLQLNLHIQTHHKSDLIMKKKLETLVLICEDINEHYYYEEINRVREDKTEDPH
jgi:hypothetical protein